MQKNVFLSLALLLSFNVRADVVDTQATTKCPFVAMVQANKLADLQAKHAGLSPEQMKALVALFPAFKDATPADIADALTMFAALAEVEAAKEVTSPLAVIAENKEAPVTLVAEVVAAETASVTEVVVPVATTEEAKKVVCSVLAQQAEVVAAVVATEEAPKAVCPVLAQQAEKIEAAA